MKTTPRGAKQAIGPLVLRANQGLLAPFNLGE
jgi:hypothetical protein